MSYKYIDDPAYQDLHWFYTDSECPIKSTSDTAIGHTAYSEPPDPHMGRIHLISEHRRIRNTLQMCSRETLNIFDCYFDNHCSYQAQPAADCLMQKEDFEDELKLLKHFDDLKNLVQWLKCVKTAAHTRRKTSKEYLLELINDKKKDEVARIRDLARNNFVQALNAYKFYKKYTRKRK